MFAPNLGSRPMAEISYPLGGSKEGSPPSFSLCSGQGERQVWASWAAVCWSGVPGKHPTIPIALFCLKHLMHLRAEFQPMLHTSLRLQILSSFRSPG